MDIRIIHPKRVKYRLFKEFEYMDLIPYSIALLMIAGEIYLIKAFVSLPYIGIG
jgi:hypothetical protein